MSEKNNLYRRNGKKVYIKQPDFNELAFVAKLWGDEETMSEIGGAYLFPEDRWDMFYKKMVQPTDGKNFYCLIYTIRDKAIGEVSFHGYDSGAKAARVNIKIHHRYRNKGYGTEALRLFLEYYFFEFGGESIIDNAVKTESAKKIFKNVGFEVVGKFRTQITHRLTKESFLNSQPRKHRKIGVLSYDNMNVMDFSIPLEVFKSVNKVVSEELFEVFTVSYKDEVVLQNNIKVSIDRTFGEDDKPDIIVIPGGNGAEEAVRDKNIIKYLLSNYNDCDYLLSAEKGIYFLNRCRMLDGILVPRVSNSEDYLNNSMGNINFTDNSFEDNGKIVISSNTIGLIKGCLNIIKKVAGEKVTEVLEKDLGFK